MGGPRPPWEDQGARTPAHPASALGPGAACRPRAPAPRIHTFLRALASLSLGLAWGWGALRGQTTGTKDRSPREHKQPWPAGGRGTEPWPSRPARVPGKNSLGSEGYSARKREAAMAGENLLYFVIRHKAAVTFSKGGLCLGAGRFCAWFQSLRPVPHFQDLNLLSQSFSQLFCPLSLFRAI